MRIPTMEKQEMRILTAGTGYWDLRKYPIGGCFARVSLDTLVTVEDTFKNCHGATARGRIVGSDYSIAFPLEETRENQ